MLLETAQLVARQAVVARVVLGELGLGLRTQAQRPADPLHVDPEHARALAATEGSDRQAGQVAQRGLVAVAQRGGDLLAQRVEVDLALALTLRRVAGVHALTLGHAAARGRRLGRAEEETLEHEVEHAPVLGRLGQRRGECLPEVGRPRPGDLAERLERVEDLRGPDRDALLAQVLGEQQQLAVEAVRALLRDPGVARAVVRPRGGHLPA